MHPYLSADVFSIPHRYWHESLKSQRACSPLHSSTVALCNLTDEPVHSLCSRYHKEIRIGGYRLDQVCVPQGAEPADIVDELCLRHVLPTNFCWAIVADACGKTKCARYESGRILKERLLRESWSIVPSSKAHSWSRNVPTAGELTAVRGRQLSHFLSSCCGGNEPEELWDALRSTALNRTALSVIDIGFNMGDWTRTILERWTDSEVYAFEAYDKTLASASLKLNRHSGILSKFPKATVRYFNYAISNVSSNATLLRGSYQSPGVGSNAGHCHGTMSTIVKPGRMFQQGALTSKPVAYENAERQPVAQMLTLTLDAFVSDTGMGRQLGVLGIDILKIDTEGWEPKVIQGGMRTLRELRPPVIFFECHAFWDDRHEPPFSLHWLTQLFENELGYDVFLVARRKLVAVSGPFYMPHFDTKAWQNCLALSAFMPGRDSFLLKYGIFPGVIPFLLKAHVPVTPRSSSPV